MKQVIIKAVSVIILAIAFMSFATKSSITVQQSSPNIFNDDYGRFQLVVKNVTTRLEPNKDFKAYVKISAKQSRDVALNTVINVRYVNGNIVSDMLELPLGEYKLEQMVLLPGTNSDENNTSIKIQLPILFTVTEKP